VGGHKKVASEQRDILSVLQEQSCNRMPRAQMGYAALRHTAAASFTWAARGVQPDLLRQAAARLDGDLRDIFYDMLNLHGWRAEVDELGKRYADARVALPKDLGGFALARVEVALEGAYLAGVVDVAAVLRRVNPAFKITGLFPQAAVIYDAVCKLAVEVMPPKPDKGKGMGSTITSYDNVDDLSAKRRGKIVQYQVTKVFDTRTFKVLLDDLGVSPLAANLIASKGHALAALDGTARFLATRLEDGVFRVGAAAVLGLPLVRKGGTDLCACGADNPRTGEHAFICRNDTAKQAQATQGQIALGAVAAGLPVLKVFGKQIRGMARRPDAPKLQFAADHAGLVLAGDADADRSFDLGMTAPDGAHYFVDVKRTALIHKDTLEQVCDRKTGQRHAVEAGEKAKFYSYHKAITNLDAKRHHVYFAVTDSCGNLSKDYTKLLKMMTRMQHPGAGIDGRYDVDGLRSQAMALARRAVGAGVWRSNYMTITAWATRTHGARALA
jgi:hypothetical protein